MAAAIKSGFYSVGLAGGVESMSTNPMAWEGGINPRVSENENAQNCLLPMGTFSFFLFLWFWFFWREGERKRVFAAAEAAFRTRKAFNCSKSVPFCPCFPTCSP